MKIVIDIKTDNAAFKDDPEELQSILIEAVENIAQTDTKECNLYDNNGNRVGAYKVTGRR